MTGDFIGPDEAHRIGLYNQVVPNEELLGVAQAMAEKLAEGPSYALEMTKRALNEEASMDLATALEAEAQVQAKCMENPNFREAYEAFVEKREARFI